MTVFVGFFHTLLAVLVISGTQKVLRPDSAARALIAGGLVPSIGTNPTTSRRLSRLLGVVELGIAFGAFAAIELWPSRLASQLVLGLAPSLVGAAFLGFNWFITRLADRDDSASCGCFGGTSTPAGPAHRWFNRVAALILFGTGIVGVLTETAPHLDLVLHDGWSASILYPVVVGASSVLFILGPALLAELAPPAPLPGSNQLFRMTDRLSP